MTTTDLHIEMNSFPMSLRQEVADFVEFLKTKKSLSRLRKTREFGYAKGKIILSDDFDEPLDNFKDYC